MSNTKSPVDVLITVPFSPSLIAPLQDVSPLLRITVHPAQNIKDVPDELWARCEVLYTDRIIPEPDLAPKLKWVQHHHAGIDSSMEFLSKDRPNLTVTTLSGAAASQIAEHVLTMLLAFTRQLPVLSAQQKKAEWPKDRWERFKLRELRSSTVGIVGYGSIGRQVARLLRAFGATVLATKNDAMQPIDSGYTPEGMGDPYGDFVHRLVSSAGDQIHDQGLRLYSDRHPAIREDARPDQYRGAGGLQTHCLLDRCFAWRDCGSCSAHQGAARSHAGRGCTGCLSRRTIATKKPALGDAKRYHHAAHRRVQHPV